MLSETWGKVWEVGIVIIEGDWAMGRSEVAEIAVRLPTREEMAQRWREGQGKLGRHSRN